MNRVAAAAAAADRATCSPSILIWLLGSDRVTGGVVFGAGLVVAGGPATLPRGTPVGAAVVGGGAWVGAFCPAGGGVATTAAEVPAGFTPDEHPANSPAIPAATVNAAAGASAGTPPGVAAERTSIRVRFVTGATRTGVCRAGWQALVPYMWLIRAINGARY